MIHEKELTFPDNQRDANVKNNEIFLLISLTKMQINDTMDGWPENEEMSSLAHVQGREAGKRAKQN